MVAYTQRQVDDYNRTDGNLHEQDGIVCEKCRNRGHYMIAQGITQAMAFCECRKRRIAFAAIQRSGLADLMQRYTLQAFTADTPWHAMMRQKADAFLADDTAWLFIGGQVGCGKTHLCTAVCGELMQRGHAVRYMQWRDESTRLKAMVGDDAAYQQAIDQWKNADVLYIDDLFKIKRQDGFASPSDADVRLAFEIINHRYNDLKKRTVVSSEWMIGELMGFDEGAASRIYERSRRCCAEVGRAQEKNYRTRG